MANDQENKTVNTATSDAQIQAELARKEAEKQKADEEKARAAELRAVKKGFVSSPFLKGWRSVKKNAKVDPNLNKNANYRHGRKFAQLHPEFNQIREGVNPFPPAFETFQKDLEAGNIPKS